MADKYWYGGGALHETEADWDDGGGATSNWHLAANDAATVKPADTDVLYFDGRAQIDAGTGKSYNCDTNCNMNVDLDGLYVKSNYDGNIGADDDQLLFSITGGDFIYEGAGTMYACIETGAGNMKVQRTVVNCTGALYLDQIENTPAGNCAEYTVLYMLAGSCFLHKDTLGDGAYAVNIYMSGGTLTADNDAYKQNGDVMTNFPVMSGGTVYWGPGIGTVTMTDGTFNWGTSVAAPASGDPITCTLLNMYGSGLFNWTVAAHTDDVPAILNQFFIYGANCVLDASLPLNSSTMKQLSTGADEISELWYGTCKFNNPSENISFEDPATNWIENHGGVIYPPDNADVKW